jgi:hypothetical protein
VVADVAGDLVDVQVRRDPTWEVEALPYLDWWWGHHVVADRPPPADVDRDTLPNLNRAWLPDPGVTIAASPVIGGAVESAAQLRAEARTTTQVVDRLRVEVREYMQHASTLTDPVTGFVLARVDARGALRINESKETTV